MRGFALSAAVVLAALPVLGQGWSPKLAADYLDSRQAAWTAWPAAKAGGGTCFSCHTGMTYLVARPSLRRALGETEATAEEKRALDGLRSRVSVKGAGEIKPAFAKEPLASEALGVETIFAALFLAQQDRGTGKMSPHTGQAFERLWASQIRDGKAAGAWRWFELDLDPWETGDSPFYGAALAAVAVSATPAAYRERPEVRERVAALTAYLRGAQASQPLHNRMMLLWTGILAEPVRNRLIEDVLGKQQADGGWSIESLGPWQQRPQAPPSVGSNAYATGFAAFVLVKAGATAPGVGRALAWLRTHQNARGYWEASSMNKQYPAGSMMEAFMQDAATGFAAAALVEGDLPGKTK